MGKMLGRVQATPPCNYAEGCHWVRGFSCMYPPDFATPVAPPVLPSCPGLPARLAAAPGSAGLHLPVRALALRRQIQICEVAPEEGRDTYLDTTFVPGNLTDKADMDGAWMAEQGRESPRQCPEGDHLRVEAPETGYARQSHLQGWVGPGAAPWCSEQHLAAESSPGGGGTVLPVIPDLKPALPKSMIWSTSPGLGGAQCLPQGISIARMASPWCCK